LEANLASRNRKQNLENCWDIRRILEAFLTSKIGGFKKIAGIAFLKYVVTSKIPISFDQIAIIFIISRK
jgi:hypothetical protein